MRARERSRRVRAAVLILAAAGGTVAALGGCGRSGPLHLPKESSLSVPASGPAPTAAVAPLRRPLSAAGRDPAPFAYSPGSAWPAAPSLHQELVTVPRSSAVLLLRG